MDRVDSGLGTSYSFPHLLLAWIFWWLRVRKKALWVKVVVGGHPEEASCPGSLRRTSFQHGWTDRKTERALACCLAQIRRPRELTIESLFLFPVSIFSSKTNTKKKKLITVCLNSQTRTKFVTLFTKTYITEAALRRATSRVRAKGPTKARRDTPLGVTVFVTVTSHYTMNKLSCVSSHLYNSINYTRNIGSLDKNIFNSLELLRQEHFHAHAR